MDNLTYSRRHFLRSSAAIGATGLLAGRSAVLAQEISEASQIVPGKADSMQILSESPEVLQSDLSSLRHRITPLNQLFVRNNQSFKSTMQPFEGGEWSIELKGLLSKEVTIDLEKLKSFPRRQVEMVLQCSGNRRSFFSETAETSGTQWGAGAIGNVIFEGVRLVDLLNHLGIEPKPEATFLRGEGRDGPVEGKEDFEHSLPWSDVSELTMLAVSINGEPIPMIHGGPVRLITPGYYATHNIKWLSTLNFESEESRNHNHAVRYRTPNRPILPGSSYDFQLDNSSTTGRMKIATQVTSLRAPHWQDQGIWQMRSHPGRIQLAGWAWNDGAAPITEILASESRGESWNRIAHASASGPFSWRNWTFDLELQKGETEIWIRAVDALGRTQPIDGAIDWNPRGYEWNGVEKIRVRV